MSKTRHPPLIITQFSRQLSHILADELTTAPQNKSIHSISDRLFVKVLLTLSNSAVYRDELLFRDFALAIEEQWESYPTGSGKSQRVYTEAVYYAEELLCRRLTLVNKLKTLPNNLHRLLLMLCRNSTNERWQKSRIRRYLEVELHIHDVFFKQVADILKAQGSNLKKTSAYAKTARKEYGPLYLRAGLNRAEVPDEMSFFNVIDAVPKPLNSSMQQLPAWYTGLVERIVLSLNEEYSLLRSCGVPPSEFKSSPLEPSKHSIGDLRELKKLKKRAEDYLRKGLCSNWYDAFAQAFKYMQTDVGGKKVGGFTSFEEFFASDIGRRMIWPDSGLDSMDEEYRPDNDPIAPDTMAEINWERFMEEHAEKFSPLMAYAFEQVIVLEKPFQGDKGLLQDPRFNALVASDAEFAESGDALLDKLIQKLLKLIKKHLPCDFDPNHDYDHDREYA